MVYAQDLKREIALIVLRNPLGSGGKEWDGAWSDFDQINWTDELKEKHGIKVEDDGIFHMAMTDFLSHFDETYIGKIGSDFKHTMFSDFKKDRLAFFEINLLGKTEDFTV